MHKYTKKEFRSLSLSKQYEVLQKIGEYISARQKGVHRIYLYAVSDFFVEMWVIFAINQIQWIEIQSNQSIINDYTTQVDIKKDLGL